MVLLHKSGSAAADPGGLLSFVRSRYNAISCGCAVIDSCGLLMLCGKQLYRNIVRIRRFSFGWLVDCSTESRYNVPTGTSC